MKVITNVNNNATVTLTEYGYEVYEKYLRSIEEANNVSMYYTIREHNNNTLLNLQHNGYVLTIQLWLLMQIFGSVLDMGSDIPFYENLILIEDANQVE